MVVTELSPEQIVAILTGVGGAVAAILMAARKSARDSDPGDHPAARASSYLVLDATQVKALVDALGMNTMSLLEKKMALDKNSAAITAHAEVTTEMRRAFERNAEQLREAADQAERLSRDMRELGDRVTRSGR